MQGFNRYVPPDVEGTTSANKLQHRRAPGTLRRDAKGVAVQTVRFELPYAVWCHHCKPHAIIGQGVRFNAVKEKVGYYYSTPIWKFTIKHTACGGALEVRTDPKNTAYVVTAGGKARDYGEVVKEGEGGVPILTDAERERRREDAFAMLEGKVEEKAAVKDNAKRIEELYRARERDWEEPWSVNSRARTTFRRERKVLRREEQATEALKDRLGTEIELLPETEEDRRRAKLVEFGDVEAGVGVAERKMLFPARVDRQPTASSSMARKGSHTTVSKTTKESRKDALRRMLVGNTRAAMNPFGK
ncbi:hypothetical protein LTR08_007191 [Meristemomyces frigidus]|nr:hypothetical protein LTR08_007191 [Meristemomyces frigidus]